MQNIYVLMLNYKIADSLKCASREKCFHVTASLWKENAIYERDTRLLRKDWKKHEIDSKQRGPSRIHYRASSAQSISPLSLQTFRCFHDRSLNLIMRVRMLRNIYTQILSRISLRERPAVCIPTASVDWQLAAFSNALLTHACRHARTFLVKGRTRQTLVKVTKRRVAIPSRRGRVARRLNLII